MSLHLNLLHERQKAERQRQRDPLKLGIMVLALVALLFVGYYFLRLGKVHGVKAELAALQARWAELEPKKTEAEKTEKALTETMKNSELMVQKIENRFYWAPLLQVLVETVPRNVQLVRLGGNSSGELVKHCFLTLDGIAAGAQPRSVAESLRTTLSRKLAENYQAVADNFKNLDDGTEVAQLDGANLPTAVFTLTYDFKTGDEVPVAAAPAAPAPAPAKAKKSDEI